MNRLKLIFLSLGLSFLTHGQQIGNYVSNGSFETFALPVSAFSPNKPKYWSEIDSGWVPFFSKIHTPFIAPYNSFGNQNPLSGNNYAAGIILFVPSSPNGIKRLYPRNRLKQPLDSGQTYCVRFHYSVTENSTYGINCIGAYFGDASLDTIIYCREPLTFLTPQIISPSTTITSDTARWISVTGTFTATGKEKYMLIGNFRTDNNSDSTIINPTNLPAVACDVYYDNVSCIQFNLPAYAGPDKPCIPGDSVFIGRQPDFAIDTGCVWYKLPNLTTAIDTISGLWVKPTMTSTFVVRQELDCSPLKWDTVVVFMDAVGLKDHKWYSDNINLFPNPTETDLTVTFGNQAHISKISIINSLGQIIHEEDLQIQKTEFTVSTSYFDKGIYLIQFKTSAGTVTKQFVKN